MFVEKNDADVKISENNNKEKFKRSIEFSPKDKTAFV